MNRKDALGFSISPDLNHGALEPSTESETLRFEPDAFERGLHPHLTASRARVALQESSPTTPRSRIEPAGANHPEESGPWRGASTGPNPDADAAAAQHPARSENGATARSGSHDELSDDDQGAIDELSDDDDQHDDDQHELSDDDDDQDDDDQDDDDHDEATDDHDQHELSDDDDQDDDQDDDDDHDEATDDDDQDDDHDEATDDDHDDDDDQDEATDDDDQDELSDDDDDQDDDDQDDQDDQDDDDHDEATDDDDQHELSDDDDQDELSDDDDRDDDQDDDDQDDDHDHDEATDDDDQHDDDHDELSDDDDQDDDHDELSDDDDQDEATDDDDQDDDEATDDDDQNDDDQDDDQDDDEATDDDDQDDDDQDDRNDTDRQNEELSGKVDVRTASRSPTAGQSMPPLVSPIGGQSIPPLVSELPSPFDGLSKNDGDDNRAIDEELREQNNAAPDEERRGGESTPASRHEPGTDLPATSTDSLPSLLSDPSSPFYTGTGDSDESEGSEGEESEPPSPMAREGNLEPAAHTSPVSGYSASSTVQARGELPTRLSLPPAPDASNPFATGNFKPPPTEAEEPEPLGPLSNELSLHLPAKGDPSDEDDDPAELPMQPSVLSQVNRGAAKLLRRPALGPTVLTAAASSLLTATASWLLWPDTALPPAAPAVAVAVAGVPPLLARPVAPDAAEASTEKLSGAAGSSRAGTPAPTVAAAVRGLASPEDEPAWVAAGVSPSGACRARSAPTRIAAPIAHGAPLETRVVNGVEVLLGYAASATEARGLRFNTTTGETTPIVEESGSRAVLGVVPQGPANGRASFAVDRAGIGGFRRWRSLTAGVPMALSRTVRGLHLLRLNGDRSVPLWPIASETDISRPALAHHKKRRFAIAFRRGDDEILGGWFDAQTLKRSRLSRLPLPRAPLEPPSLAINNRRALVATAVRAAPDRGRRIALAELRYSGKTDTVDALRPVLATESDTFDVRIGALLDGRWVVTWVEANGDTQTIKALTVDEEFDTVGRLNTLSAPGQRARSGALVNVDDGLINFYLVEEESRTALWAVAMACD